MTNKELADKLKQLPDDAKVYFEYCNISTIRYEKETNSILVD